MAERDPKEEKSPGSGDVAKGSRPTERIDEVPEKYRGHEEIESAGAIRTERRFTKEGKSMAPGEEKAFIAAGRFREKSGEEVGFPTTGKSGEEAMTGRVEEKGPAVKTEEEIRAGKGGEFGEAVREGWEAKSGREMRAGEYMGSGNAEKPASQITGEEKKGSDVAHDARSRKDLKRGESSDISEED